MGRGRLIVLEGVDGSGTSTQAALLNQALWERGYPAHKTREPSDGPIGALIRQILTRRFVIQGPSGGRSPRMETMALLFAADRLDHLESEMLPNLGDGITVVCDRYIHSSIAYQTLTSRADVTDALAWVETLNRHARTPDLIMILNVSPEVAAKRRLRRGGAEEIYEDDDLQSRLVEFYADLPSRFPDQNMVTLDGNRTVEEVHEGCLDETLKFLAECRP